MGKYINPLTDFSSKQLVSQAPHKGLLLALLNELLKEEQGQLTDLTYLKGEHLDANLAI